MNTFVLTSLVDIVASFLIFGCHLHFWFKCQWMWRKWTGTTGHTQLTVTLPRYLKTLLVAGYMYGDSGRTSKYYLLPSLGAAGRKFPYLSWPGNQRFTWHKSSAAHQEYSSFVIICTFWAIVLILVNLFFPVDAQHRFHLNKGCTHPFKSYIILSILRSQMDFCTMEMILGSQNWQD